ncbi:MAG: preprotein translocase subunit SecA [Eubacteriales bacterium]|jgi:preprotein translocase subunit SecA|nr:preprotein translocase subunit SecA [Eubacteriales bacterium]MDD4133646.1 preprotein translocase subunit SecA [Eubacteriales bacterium]NLO13512.1 preprotein translocase subunit SecA [Clostridiales bacterium]
MFNKLKEALGMGTEAQLKPLRQKADAIEALEPEYEKMSDAQLSGKTALFRERVEKGESLDDLLNEAFAVVREASKRTLGLRPFRVQLIGGIVLHQGRIAEMKTGEGKTLTACLPAYLNALAGKGVHIVTVNDYLAKFQGEDMGKLFRFLGMSVGIIVHDLTGEQRRAAYACDITYGTNNEMGFDYLRDNMVIYGTERVQRGHSYAIVDEVDSILIDEARTPLIISGQGEKSTDLYERAERFVGRLKAETDYTVEEKDKAAVFTEEGTHKAEQAFSIENLSDPENNELNHHLIQALKANALMKRDVDYVVQNGEVVIVDEFTGRLMVGRRYSDGLHQAIEAKEHVQVARESKTLATITFQNYFRMYKKLSGMTGTAKTEEEEFQGIYALDVVQVPTNMPMIRKDLNDMVYRGKKGKYQAVAEEIEVRHKTGQPLLVGTISVEVSELLSQMLSRRGIPHEVLNAKHHAREAAIVAQAGHLGAVTIATNMAGRGTDILLGGNPDYLARRSMRQEEVPEEIIEEASGRSEQVSEEVLQARKRYNQLKEEFKKTTDAEHEKVVALGGLHIIGTERHESRRIDNQLRGRAGRQGDPGSSQFFISLEDDLMRLFGGERIEPLIAKMGMDETEPLAAGMLTKQIENAQKRIESRNYEIRKHVLQYDDVMNQQREVIYRQRSQVLEGKDMQAAIQGMVDKLVEEAVARFCAGENKDWDVHGLQDYVERLCVPYGTIKANADAISGFDKDGITALLKKAAGEFYSKREADIAALGIDMRELERSVLLRSVDTRWMDHIDAMDQLRDGIGLRAYAQRNPVNEYKLESYDMFDEMSRLIQEDTVRQLFQLRIQRAPERKQVARPISEGTMPGAGAKGGQPVVKKPGDKIGRNSPCPCGSGKKYKHCHGMAGRAE